jgi:hypothetical protein
MLPIVRATAQIFGLDAASHVDVSFATSIVHVPPVTMVALPTSDAPRKGLQPLKVIPVGPLTVAVVDAGDLVVPLNVEAVHLTLVDPVTRSAVVPPTSAPVNAVAAGVMVRTVVADAELTTNAKMLNTAMLATAVPLNMV